MLLNLLACGYAPKARLRYDGIRSDGDSIADREDIMVRHRALSIAFLLFGSSLWASELDAEFGPDTASDAKATLVAYARGASLASAKQDVPRASELDAELPTQSRFGGFHGGFGGFRGGFGGFRGGFGGFRGGFGGFRGGFGGFGGFNRGFGGFGFGFPRFGWGGLGFGGFGWGLGLGLGYGGWGWPGWGYGGYGLGMGYGGWGWPGMGYGGWGYGGYAPLAYYSPYMGYAGGCW
jgi:hypothetical protein